MKLLFNVYTCLLIILFSSSLSAQNIIWSEDFGAGTLPNNWTNNDTTSPVIKWEWTDDVDKGRISGQPAFSSQTVSNGFALFNSAILGNTNHDAKLTTSSIDCTGEPAVFIRFENQYGYFSPQSMALVGVSNDNITWSYDTLFTDIGNNQLFDPLQIVELDISTVAANQPTVYIQFRWIGTFEYAWRVDDIQLQDAPTPPRKHDLSIGLVAIPSNNATPLVHVKPIELGVRVHNKGIISALNVKLKTIITNTTTNTVVYKDSIITNNLNPNDSVVLEMTSLFTPSSTGNYHLKYELSQDSTDEYSLDNYFDNYFSVNDSLFSKDNDKGLGSARPSANGDYFVGNIYEVVQPNYYADKVIFTCGHPTFGGLLMGHQVDIILYEVDSAVNIYDAASFNTQNNNNVTPVGYGQYNFTIDDNGLEDIYFAAITDLNGAKVLLKANHTYFLMLSFSGSSNILRVGTSDNLRYEAFYSTIVQIGNTWYLRGFGSRITAIARLVITNSSNTSNEVLRRDRLVIKVYPNPVKDIISIDILTKERTDVEWSILDITGRVVHVEQLKNINNKQLMFDVSALISGTYFIKVRTGMLSKVERFVVIK